jgi:hypothetical protein
MEMKVLTRVSDTHVRLWPLLSGSMVFRIQTCIIGGHGLEPCAEFVWFSIFDIVLNWWRALLSLGNQCLKMWCCWGGDWSTIKFSQIWLFKKHERQILKYAYTFFCYLLEPSVEMWWCLKIFLIQFFKHCFPQKIIEFATISSLIFCNIVKHCTQVTFFFLRYLLDHHLQLLWDFYMWNWWSSILNNL